MLAIKGIGENNIAPPAVLIIPANSPNLKHLRKRTEIPPAIVTAARMQKTASPAGLLGPIDVMIKPSL